MYYIKLVYYKLLGNENKIRTIKRNRECIFRHAKFSKDFMPYYEVTEINTPSTSNDINNKIKFFKRR